MATCPNCGEYLDTNHRCRFWRPRLRVWRMVAVGGLAGAAATTGASLVFYGVVSAVPILIGAVLGSVVMLAYLRGEP